MREFELIIDSALKNGLSPEYIVPINTPFLLQALGFRCGRAGLEAFPAGTNPLPVTIDMHYNWPFPQFIAGDKFNFLIVRDKTNQLDIIYSISDDHLTTSLVFVIDQSVFGEGWLMDIADFGEYAFMTNGVAMVYWNVLGSWNVMESSATVPKLGTLCNFKGQMVGGNVRTAWHDCDETHYIWSKIGKLDFTPDEENEAGYRRCPYGGEVFNVRRLDDVVVGYSSEGVTLLVPTEEGPFRFIQLSDTGIVNRGAVNGNLKRQVYVGKDLVLREVTGEGIKEIGYRKHIEQLVHATRDIIVTHDKSKDDFFISNGIRTFLLSPSGLTEIQQHPSAVWRRDKSRIHLLPSTVDSSMPMITTELIDFGYKGQKTIQTLETDAFSVTEPEAAVEFSNDLESIDSTNFIPINNMGIATVPVAGNLFRFKVRFDSINEDFRISYIKPRYKMTDLRGIRGVYAPPLRGQS